MGSSSLSIHRGCDHWQKLLLVVSLLNFWSQPTTAQVTVELAETLEGSDVTLHIYHNAQYVEHFLWYRGEIPDMNNIIAYLSVNPQNHVRNLSDAQAIVNTDGSLVLKNVSMKDAGAYTIVIHQEGCTQMIACGWLDVYPHVSVPTLRASNTTLTEGKDAVVLTCYVDAEVIEWLLNGTILRYTPRMQLSFDRRNLTIDPFLRWDVGEYKCKGSNRKSGSESAGLKLDVKFE